MSTTCSASAPRRSCARSTPRRYGSSSARFKVALPITDVRATRRPEIIEVVLAATGKPMRLRRDDVQIWPGMVVLPWWLAAKAKLTI